MGEQLNDQLSREELDLVRFYRGLSMQKQFEVLENVESSYNATRRMEELAGREVEKNFPGEGGGWS